MMQLKSCVCKRGVLHWTTHGDGHLGLLVPEHASTLGIARRLHGERRQPV